MDHKYKKYILFAWDQYYPLGGLTDVFHSYDTIEEARIQKENHTYYYAEIVDRDSWRTVK